MPEGHQPDDGMLEEAEMPNVVDRISHVEGQVSEFSLRLSAVETAIARLEQRIDTRFDAVDRRFDAVERGFDAVDRRFVWIIGIQMTTLIAMLGAMLSRG